MVDSPTPRQDNDSSSRTDELLRVCRTAVREAQERNRKLGVANVYSYNGRLYYEMPNGELSLTPPPDQTPPTAS